MSVTLLASLDDTPDHCWPNAGHFPFLNQAFLQGLERSGAASKGSGWQGAHLALRRPGADIHALLPSYIKSHSRGEYVFDQAWAAAYHRHGLIYYPRLVSTIPFSPVAGPRCLLAPPYTEAAAAEDFLRHIPDMVATTQTSSWHGLFLNQTWRDAAQAQGLALRAGCQFYWQDRGFGDFEGFLGSMTAKRRKTLRRERSKVAEAGISLRRLSGSTLEPMHWEFFYRCYAHTYLVRGQRPYLPLSFFLGLGQAIPDQLMLVMAYQQGQAVASALFLYDEHSLYGRYWGATQAIDCLHFEACYYQGIEFCLERGLRHFDPGTQGEHKIARGFSPELTWSAHWLAEPAFMDAVSRFVQEEEQQVRQYQAQARSLLPFRE